LNAALFERILGIFGKKGLDSDDLCRGTESMTRDQGATAKTSAAHWHHYIIEVLHLFIDFERAGGCPGDYLEIIVWVDKSRACLARHTAAYLQKTGSELGVITGWNDGSIRWLSV
jgi:hypothetical protein